MKLVLVIVLATACSGQTQLPKGPPPEYEDEPVVGSAEGGTTQRSMVTAQDAAPAPAVVDAGARE